MYIISTRRNFSHPDRMGTRIYYKEVNRKLQPKGDVELSSVLKPKERILLLVHGYNNEMEDTLEAYKTVEDYFRLLRANNPYDHVVGFTWPGGEMGVDYFRPRARTKKIAPHLAFIIEQLASISNSSIDVMCHSMGTRLTLQAMSYVRRSKVRNCFSLAAAVEDDSIEKDEKFYKATQKCKYFFVFHSSRDKVLKYLYAAAEDLDDALGLKGPEDAAKIMEFSKNVRVFNCTRKINKHGQYKKRAELYRVIAKHHNQPLRGQYFTL